MLCFCPGLICKDYQGHVALTRCLLLLLLLLLQVLLRLVCVHLP
jgi:hypothetical protein